MAVEHPKPSRWQIARAYIVAGIAYGGIVAGCAGYDWRLACVVGGGLLWLDILIEGHR